MIMQFNMEVYKIIGGLLAWCLITVACTTTTDSPKNKKPEARIDSYDNILRPPPPPPNLSHLRPLYSVPNQRFQRQNSQFRQPYMMRNPVFSSYERYPPIIPLRPTEAPSFLQKVSGWLFSSDTNNVPKTYNAPSPIYGAPLPHPSSTYGAPSSNAPPLIYGVPSSRGPPAKLQQQQQPNGKKKECNACNYFPWIPVIRYQTNNNHAYPSKQSLSDQSNAYLPPKQNILDDLSGPPTTAAGKPFSSLSKIPVTSEPINSKLVTNSYGTPISTNMYGPPLPITNDGGEPPILPPKPSFNYDFNDNDNGYYNNDNIEHLETNNVPLLTKPNPKDLDNKKSNVNNDEPFRGSHFINTNPESGRGVHVLQPIPFPNLSSIPLPPIFNARPFNTFNKTHNNDAPNRSIYGKPFTTNEHSYNEHSSSPNTLVNNIVSASGIQSMSNVQLIPSVPIAEFIASVDYPINIIQSPLLEIDASKSSNSNSNEQDKYNLNNNPIVVQNESYPHDSYSAASGGNDYSNEYEKDKDATNEVQFLPTPLSPIDVNKGSFRPPISYSFIDQTFSKYPVASSTPSNLLLEQSTNHLESNTPSVYKNGLSDSLQMYLKPSAPNKDSKIFRDSQQNVTSNSTNGFRYLESGYVHGRWPPPNENPTKKPKTIQIIIPYTSNNQPSPFKFSSNDIASSAGWVPVISDVVRNYGRKIPAEQQSTINDLHTTNSLVDYHESSESKIVSSSAPSYNNTTSKYTESPSYKPIKRVKAPEPLIDTGNSRLSLDMKKLQQNIDDWTVQEFSKIYKRQQKASTTSHLKRSKKIPDEYFTTTPAQKKVTKLSYKINELNSSLLDNEGANTIQGITDYNVKNTTKEKAFDTTKSWRTPKYTEFTTIIPKTTTRHSWEQIQTSISPLTKEKVYVVTPQPWNPINASVVASNYSANLKDLSFKSPRFLVRPTPGPTGSQKDTSDTRSSWKTSFNWLQSINNLEEVTTESWSSKSHFGLSTLSAYTPPDGTSVQTYSGHSKVATAVTASSVSHSSSQ